MDGESNDSYDYIEYYNTYIFQTQWVPWIESNGFDRVYKKIGTCIIVDIRP